MLEKLKSYMKEMEYTTIRDFRDIIHKNIVDASGLKVYDGYAKVNLEKCTSCGLCWNVGHCSSITHPDGVTTIDEETCMACSTCVDVYAPRAMEMVQR